MRFVGIVFRKMGFSMTPQISVFDHNIHFLKQQKALTKRQKVRFERRAY